ncbi:MAG: 3-methylornithyl-N6-L-lysine dehydrogenase [Methanomassiliicoccales archaeon PtaU1.Bin124]|nr:MAG: 3-methylornithyl-N6-L-lysine dehydrogenase [Methanomassiliicoccales archaeon PtaU1.Bin124]
MTRLTQELVSGLGASLPELDGELIRITGLGLRGLALASIGMPANHVFPIGTKVAAVPMTSGLGRISGFTETLASISKHIGLESFVTKESDVAGIREAYGLSADVLLMADDNAFVAVSAKKKVIADNSECTALGYMEALQRAAGSIGREEILVIGAGPLGMNAIRLILERGMRVRVVERNPRILRSITRDMGLEAHMLLEEALVNARFIFNASPAPIHGNLVRENAILANPGVPLDIDEMTRKRCKAIIHDPLAIGTAVMLAKVLATHKNAENGKP